MILSSKFSNASLLTSSPSQTGQIKLLLSERLHKDSVLKGCERLKLPDVPVSST